MVNYLSISSNTIFFQLMLIFSVKLEAFMPKNVSVSPELLAMEDLCLTVPLVSQIIFNNLDDESLANSKISTRKLKEFLEDEKLISIRILRKCEENFEGFSESWKKVIHNAPREIVKELAAAVQEFFKKRQSRYEKQWSPPSGSVTLSCLNGSCLFGRRLTLFKTRTLYHRLSRLFMSCDQNNYYVHKLPTLMENLVLWGSIILRCQESSFKQSLL